MVVVRATQVKVKDFLMATFMRIMGSIDEHNGTSLHF